MSIALHASWQVVSLRTGSSWDDWIRLSNLADLKADLTTAFSPHLLWTDSIVLQILWSAMVLSCHNSGQLNVAMQINPSRGKHKEAVDVHSACPSIAQWILFPKVGGLSNGWLWSIARCTKFFLLKKQMSQSCCMAWSINFVFNWWIDPCNRMLQKRKEKTSSKKTSTICTLMMLSTQNTTELLFAHNLLSCTKKEQEQVHQLHLTLFFFLLVDWMHGAIAFWSSQQSGWQWRHCKWVESVQGVCRNINDLLHNNSKVLVHVLCWTCTGKGTSCACKLQRKEFSSVSSTCAWETVGSHPLWGGDAKWWAQETCFEVVWTTQPLTQERDDAYKRVRSSRAKRASQQFDDEIVDKPIGKHNEAFRYFL